MKTMDEVLQTLVADALPGHGALAAIRRRVLAQEPPPGAARQVADIFACAFAGLERWKTPCAMLEQ
ncbi:MAG: hypothetical protein PHO66_07100 [Eubacteriales bacterium]|nr:hypothetical protein [Eubacteriales bacterium]